ncbi:unnamed protein product, partial [Symbiodinium necroappetens]
MREGHAFFGQDLPRVRVIPINQNAEHLNKDRCGSVGCFFHCLSFLHRFFSVTGDFVSLGAAELLPFVTASLELGTDTMTRWRATVYAAELANGLAPDSYVTLEHVRDRTLSGEHSRDPAFAWVAQVFQQLDMFVVLRLATCTLTLTRTVPASLTAAQPAHRLSSRSPPVKEELEEPPAKRRRTMKPLLDEDTGVQSMYDSILERAQEAKRSLHSIEAIEQIYTLAHECANGDARKVIGLVGALSFELHASLAARALLLTVARWTFMASMLAGLTSRDVRESVTHITKMAYARVASKLAFEQILALVADALPHWKSEFQVETAEAMDPAAAMKAVNFRKTLGAVARAKSKPLAKALQE